MKQTLLLSAVVIAIAIGAAGGFWLGVREAWELALMADAARIGSNAVPRLVAIEVGKTDALKTALELDVDNGLIWSHYFGESPLHAYLGPVWGISGAPENRKEMARLADYRRTHPWPLATDTGGTQAIDEMRERRQIIDSAVRRFALQR